MVSPETQKKIVNTFEMSHGARLTRISVWVSVWGHEYYHEDTPRCKNCEINCSTELIKLCELHCIALYDRVALCSVNLH